MATKPYFLVGVKYGNRADKIVLPSSSAIRIAYGGSVHYYSSEQRFTLGCLKKYMTGNLSFGNDSNPTALQLSCQNCYMEDNVYIDIKEVSGANYDIITDTCYWNVPYGVTYINVCCVGGGGGGGGSKEINDGRTRGSGGGGGGYVVQGSFSNLNANNTFYCSIGGEGGGGRIWTSDADYSKGCGGSGGNTFIYEVSSPSNQVFASGGGGGGWSSSNSPYCGSGGTGGGLGVDKVGTLYYKAKDYFTGQSGADGGTEQQITEYDVVRCQGGHKNGHSDFTIIIGRASTKVPQMWGDSSSGQAGTTQFNGVYYGHGGGGGPRGYVPNGAEYLEFWSVQGGNGYCGGGMGGSYSDTSYASNGVSGTTNSGGGGGGGGGSIGRRVVAGQGGSGGKGVIIITW